MLVAGVLPAAGLALVAPAASADTAASATVARAAAAGVARAPSRSAADGPVYVALGDSYSSGEANPPFDLSEACHRSSRAWPSLVGQDLGWRTTNLACSGAQTKDVVEPYRGEPAQAQALAAVRPRPDVVSVTIGGNDAGFGTVLGLCVVSDCVTTGGIAAANAFILTRLPGRLKSTYRAIGDAAPQARLVVVGYPRLVPREQSDVVPQICPWLSNRERKALNRTADLLNLVLRFKAWTVGATFVDVSDVMRGHELCTADSWYWQVGVGADPSFFAHPTGPGQRAIADAVVRRLDGARLTPSRPVPGAANLPVPTP